MPIREFISIFTTAAVAIWVLNVLWLAVLAAPITWLWNRTVVPLGFLPAVGYWRVFGMLLLWFLLRLAHTGVKVSARSQNSE